MRIRCLLQRPLPLARPLITALGSIARRTVWLVRIGEGWGEAAPLPGYGGEPPEQCGLALDRAFRQGVMPGPETPCARAAVDGALRADAAVREGRPLAGRAGRVAICRLIERDDEIAADDRCIKLKSSGEPRRDAARVRWLCSEHPGLAIRLDANGRWDAEGAHAFARLAGHLVEFVEQPLPAGDLAGCAALRRAGLRVALDEGVRSERDLLLAIAHQACDAVVLKPNWLGGWEPTERLATLARDAGLAVIISSALGSTVERAHAAHLALALDLPGPHGLGTGAWLAEDLATWDEGWIHDAPGLGIALHPW